MAMRARVVNAKIRLAEIDEAAKTWADYTNRYKGKGLHAGYMMVDPATGKMVSVTIWKDSAAQENYSQSRDRVLGQEAMAKYFDEPLALSLFEVKVAVED